MSTPAKCFRIYKIVNTEDDMVYIGSTSTKIENRFSVHKCYAEVSYGGAPIHNHMRDIGIDKFSIELLHVLVCDTRRSRVVEQAEIWNVPAELRLNSKSAIVNTGYIMIEKRRDAARKARAKMMNGPNGEKHRATARAYARTYYAKNRQNPKWVKMHNERSRKHQRAYRAKKKADKRTREHNRKVRAKRVASALAAN